MGICRRINNNAVIFSICVLNKTYQLTFIIALADFNINADFFCLQETKAQPHQVELDLPGYAIGGLAVGESTQTMYDIIDAVEPYMPKDKTRYLMGVGTPSNIIEGVARGVDFFDCVMPARNARHAKLFTWEGAINLKNAKYERDMQPIDPACDCPVCRRYSRAYLRHLFKAEEMLAMRLSVMHNLYFYNKLMERIRQALDEGRFEEFRRTYSERLDRRI